MKPALVGRPEEARGMGVHIQDGACTAIIACSCYCIIFKLFSAILLATSHLPYTVKSGVSFGQVWYHVSLSQDCVDTWYVCITMVCVIESKMTFSLTYVLI